MTNAVAIAVLAGALVLAGCGRGENIKSGQIKAGPYTYNVPSAYGSVFHGGGMDTPADVAGFNFLALLPDMKALSEGDRRQDGNGTGFHNFLRGYLQYYPEAKSLGGAQLLSRRLSASPDIDVHRFREESGFKIYIPKTDFGMEVWTTQRQDGTTFVMECRIKAGSAIYPYCTVFDVWNGVQLEYSYGKDYAAQALMIDDKVKRLLNSFRSSN